MKKKESKDKENIGICFHNWKMRPCSRYCSIVIFFNLLNNGNGSVL